jgi:hypothetical protein
MVRLEVRVRGNTIAADELPAAFGQIPVQHGGLVVGRLGDTDISFSSAAEWSDG